jgi:hypothetical protein
VEVHEGTQARTGGPKVNEVSGINAAWEADNYLIVVLSFGPRLRRSSFLRSETPPPLDCPISLWNGDGSCLTFRRQLCEGIFQLLGCFQQRGLFFRFSKAVAKPCRLHQSLNSDISRLAKASSFLPEGYPSG